jgi:hypothetical protein
MSETIQISPPNSQLFISDKSGGSVPDFVPQRAVLSTPSGITFLCFPEQEGPTQVTLSRLEEMNSGEAPAFEGELETPSRIVNICTIEWKSVLQAQVTTTRTHVKIWLSHPQWPDKVVIGLR